MINGIVSYGIFIAFAGFVAWVLYDSFRRESERQEKERKAIEDYRRRQAMTMAVSKTRIGE